MNTIRVMIADADVAFRGALEAAITQEENMEVVCSTGRSEEAVGYLHVERVDALLLDILLEQGDGISVLQELRLHNQKALTIMLSVLLRGEVINRSAIGGVDCFMAKPCSVEYVVELLRRLRDSERRACPPKQQMEIMVTEILQWMGFPAHVKGYQYLRTGVLLASEDANLLECVTKGLYPDLAQRYHTSAGNVERAIRYAVAEAWQEGSLDAWEKYFGISRGTTKKKPSNSALIAVLADKVRLYHGNRYEK